jgi:predicted regulator of Ras-like GTPase activity (Roadblock/LC7/MglB family)
VIFQERFETLLKRIDGAQAALLMGFDGISVVSIATDGVKLDMELIGAELSVQLNQLRTATFTRSFGALNEFVFTSAERTIFLKIITPDYFVALVLGPGALLGKARFLLKLAQPELAAALQ